MIYLHLIYQIVYRQCAYTVTVQVWQSVYLFLKCCYCKSISFNQKWPYDFKETWLKLNSFYPTFSRVFMWSVFMWSEACSCEVKRVHVKRVHVKRVHVKRVHVKWSVFMWSEACSCEVKRVHVKWSVFMWSVFDWPQHSWNIAHFTFNSNQSINQKY